MFHSLKHFSAQQPNGLTYLSRDLVREVLELLTPIARPNFLAWASNFLFTSCSGEKGSCHVGTKLFYSQSSKLRQSFKNHFDSVVVDVRFVVVVDDVIVVVALVDDRFVVVDDVVVP